MKFKRRRVIRKVEKSNKCKNCGTKFIGNYCPNCSQSIKDFEQPISFLIVDFMGNMFAFDTRFWKTLKSVLFRPGRMSEEFIEGHRVRYMPPFRFYVFISFVFFLLLNISVNNDIKDNPDAFLSSDTAQMAQANIVRDSILKEVNKGLKENLDSATFAKVNEKIKYKMNIALSDSSKHKIETEINLKFDDDDSYISDIFNNKTIIEDIQKHPDMYIERALKYISWAMFLFMPFYAFLLRLFFRRTHKFYLTHLIFALNQHALLFSVFVVMIILDWILPNSWHGIFGYFMLLPLIHHVLGVKQLYKRSWRASISRLLSAGFIYFFLLLLGLSAIALYSLYA